MRKKKLLVQNAGSLLKSTKPDLKLYFCSHAAAKYAVEHWHYSRAMPCGKDVKIGVCENEEFVGCVIFGSGATPFLGDPYGLKQIECCELTRVALDSHETPVSRIVSIALKMLKKQSPGLRLIVSFADTTQEHHGGIYQAGGWIYSGKSNNAKFFVIKGRITHPRSVGAIGGKQTISWVRENLDRHATVLEVPGKHRYLMPLDKQMRNQIMPLSQPYPKRPKQAIASDQDDSGGAAPTGTLHQC